MTAVAPTTPRSSDALIDLLLRQAACLDALVALTQRQVELAEKGRFEDVELALPGRARLLEQLARLSREADERKGQSAAHWAEFNDVDRRAADQLAQRVAASHQRALRLDRQLRELLEQAAGHISAELKQTWNAGRAMGAYRAAPSAQDANRFTDERG